MTANGSLSRASAPGNAKAGVAVRATGGATGNLPAALPELISALRDRGVTLRLDAESGNVMVRGRSRLTDAEFASLQTRRDAIREHLAQPPGQTISTRPASATVGGGHNEDDGTGAAKQDPEPRRPAAIPDSPWRYRDPRYYFARHGYRPEEEMTQREVLAARQIFADDFGDQIARARGRR